MAEKKTKVQLPNIGVVDAVEVGIKESAERWTEIQLDDGTLIRIRPVVLTVFRIEGHYDQDGNPLYQVKANQVMTADAQEHLKKDAIASGSKAH